MFSPHEPLEKKNFVSRFIYREESFLGRQQLLSLIYYTLQITLISVLFLPKAIATSRLFFIILLSLLQIVATISFVGYIKKWFKLSNALRIVIYTIHYAISLQMIYISANNVELLTGFHKTLLMGNITLMVLNVALSIIACQRHDPLVLSLLSLLVYTVCALITHDRWFEILAAILVVTFLLLGCLGSSLVWSTRKIQKENLDLKKEDEELFAVFNLRREQVKAYVKLAEQEMTDDKIGAVFDILGKKAQKNVMYNMKRYFFSKKFNENAIGKAFPTLTPSEREVCRLVMQERKLGEICSILQKNESNITTTRSNIRKKLGLAPGDDLKETLWKMLDGVGYKRDTSPRRPHTREE